MEIEIFGFGGCSFASNCMLGHGEKYRIPCENTYTTSMNPNDACKHICSALNCSLCSVWDLYNANVSAIKIQGREKDYRRVLPLTKVFRKAIDIAKTCTTKEEYLNLITMETPYWWKKVFCDQSQCKFENQFDAISISNILNNEYTI